MTLRITILLSAVLLISSCHERESKPVGHATAPALIELQDQRVDHDISSLDQVTIGKISRDIQPRTYRNTTLYRDTRIGEIMDSPLHKVMPAVAPLKTGEDEQTMPGLQSTVYYYPKTKWQLSLVLDNDIFDNRDYYYTNGLRLELVTPFMDRSPVRKIFPGLKDAEVDQHGISLIQNIYTPTNPDTVIILPNDHPFSSYLAIGQFRDNYSMTRKLRLRSEIRIGLLGPASLGQQVQTSIHEIKPVGWQNQVSNDVVIDYAFLVEKGLISNAMFEWNITGEMNAGTLYNRVGAGANIRVGNFMPVFRGVFSHFQNQNPGGRFQYWLFMDSKVHFVGYDATLQGGLFSRDNIYVIPDEQLARAVFQASFGFAVYYNNIGLEYRHYYETPRFRNAYHFGWGSIKAVIAF